MNKRIIRPGESGYQQCTVTIMDTTDPDITFDKDGVSNWVNVFQEKVLPVWKPQGDQNAFAIAIKRIKESGKGKEYDCALGLSGGVDSSYLAYIAKREGLRPLVVHVDTGWNSDISVTNIERIVKACEFDLFTVVINWDEMADLQRAFLMSGVPNQDVPQDHAILAAFYGTAAEHNIKWVLSGRNYACESILPSAWGYGASDLHHLKAIHQRFGQRPLGQFPCMSHLRYGVMYTFMKGMRVANLLDLIEFNKLDVIQILEHEFGWQNYPCKHFESRWTRFFQGWWLINKFGYDKRLAHLSSLILSGQMTRRAALEEMKETPYTTSMMENDRELVLKKLGMSMEEWNQILISPPHSHDEYPKSERLMNTMIEFRNMLWRSGFTK